MKKTIFAAMIAVLCLSSCGKKEKTDEEQKQALNDATHDELVAAVADRDQLLVLVNEISDGMNQIKTLENIMTVSSNGAANETPDQRRQIQADIAAIQQALQERRQRLDELEKKLSSSNLNNSKLQQTIESLRSQIDNQTKEIANLRGQLNQAKTQINELNAAVDTLNTTVSAVSAERDQAQQQSTDLTNELNTCYYAIGSSSELKDHNILKSGFLRKTKIMEGEFDMSFFNKGDKRSLTTIPLHSKKAKVLTKQPASSYTITEQNGQKVLNITNPTEFWNLSNYLVIQID